MGKVDALIEDSEIGYSEVRLNGYYGVVSN